jgi:methionyl-tRNA formyltransferase
MPDTEPLPVKIYATTKIAAEHQHAAGSIQTDGKTFLDVACGDGFIRIDELQLPGKKQMKIDGLLRGFKWNEQSYFK